MADFIRRSRSYLVKSYRLNFDFVGEVGHGFGFDCTKEGKVEESKLNPVALEHYRKCISKEHNVQDGVVVPHTNRVIEPAIIRCGCGVAVKLWADAEPCPKCGTEYNLSGQALSANWRETTYQETGEICNW